MSLNDEERKILVRKELQRARETFDEIEVLRQAQNGMVQLIAFIILCFMLSMLFLSAMDFRL